MMDRSRNVVFRDLSVTKFLHFIFFVDTVSYSDFIYDSKHTCFTEDRQKGQPQATTILIGEIVKHKYRDISLHNAIPKEIVSYMQTEVGISVSYRKAWRGKRSSNKVLIWH